MPNNNNPKEPRRGVKPITINNDGTACIHVFSKKFSTEYIAIIDAEDVEKVKNYVWSVAFTGYAQKTKQPYLYDSYRKVYLHQVIMGKPEDNTLEIDHINRDRLDNRKENLRIVTKEENLRNRPEKYEKHKTNQKEAA